MLTRDSQTLNKAFSGMAMSAMHQKPEQETLMEWSVEGHPDVGLPMARQLQQPRDESIDTDIEG
jgi:hypothetical protein